MALIIAAVVHRVRAAMLDTSLGSRPERNLFNRMLGCLHHCLTTGEHYDEVAAFPTASAPPEEAAA